MIGTEHVTRALTILPALLACQCSLVSARAAGPAGAPSPQLVRTLSGHTKEVTSLAFSPNGKLLASASKDRKVKVWRLDTGHSTDLGNGVSEANSVTFSPDGTILAVGTEVGVVLLDARSGEFRAVSKGQPRPVNAVAFSPDGKLLASACDDKTASVWAVPSLDPKRAFAQHGGAVASVAFSPDGKSVASGGGKGVFLWDPETGEARWTHDKVPDLVDWIGPVAVSPDGNLVVRGGAHLDLLRARTGDVALALANAADVLSVAFSPDGKLLATAGLDNAVSLYDVQTGQRKGVLRGHSAWVRAVAFSPDGKMLASGSDDGAVKLWNLTNPQALDAPAAAAPAPEVLLDRNQTLGGADSKKLPNGMYCDSAAQPLAKGDQLAVTVNAPAFHPQVVVRCTPAGAGYGVTDTVASAGIGKDCRLEFFAPETGTAQILVFTPDAGGAGAYHLRVERLAKDVSTREPQGEWVSGSVASSDDYPLLPEAAHAGQRLVLIAESSDFVPSLVVSGPAGADAGSQYQWTNTPKSHVTQSRLEVTIPVDGRYVVGVTSAEPIKSGSKFRLLIRREAGR